MKMGKESAACCDATGTQNNVLFDVQSAFGAFYARAQKNKPLHKEFCAAAYCIFIGKNITYN